MTQYFEVLRRDGPARLGKLLLDRQIGTPNLLEQEDYVSVGSIFDYGSVEDAIIASKSLNLRSNGQKRLVIMPYVPSALHYEPTLQLHLPQTEIEGPKGVVVHPF